jgi:dTDP-4-dehydrorhamnose 3,5-epimerase
MKISIDSRHLGEIVVLKSERFADARGFFMEVFRRDQFQELGLPAEFVQSNHSGSIRGVLRGLHFQYDPPMGKLMRVTRGCGFLVAVDVRKGSPTVGQWFGIELSSEDARQVWAPAGFARGFCVLSDYAEIQYQCTGLYSSGGESCIRWNDPEVGIQWPVRDPILSDRDRVAPTLSQWLASPLADLLKY